MAYIATPTELVGGAFLIYRLRDTLFGACNADLHYLGELQFTRVLHISRSAARAMQHTHFGKKMFIKGGFLLLFVAGAGRYSVDCLLRKRV